MSINILNRNFIFFANLNFTNLKKNCEFELREFKLREFKIFFANLKINTFAYRFGYKNKSTKICSDFIYLFFNNPVYSSAEHFMKSFSAHTGVVEFSALAYSHS